MKSESLLDIFSLEARVNEKNGNKVAEEEEEKLIMMAVLEGTCQKKIKIATAQCDEMKIFGQNLNIMSNRFIWIPIDREKSVFKKIMPGSAFFNLSKFDIFKNS